MGEGESQAEEIACAKALWKQRRAQGGTGGQVSVGRPLGLKQEDLMVSPRLRHD